MAKGLTARKERPKSPTGLAVVMDRRPSGPIEDSAPGAAQDAIAGVASNQRLLLGDDGALSGAKTYLDPEAAKGTDDYLLNVAPKRRSSEWIGVAVTSAEGRVRTSDSWLQSAAMLYSPDIQYWRTQAFCLSLRRRITGEPAAPAFRCGRDDTPVGPEVGAGRPP